MLGWDEVDEATAICQQRNDPEMFVVYLFALQGVEMKEMMTRQMPGGAQREHGVPKKHQKRTRSRSPATPSREDGHEDALTLQPLVHAMKDSKEVTDAMVSWDNANKSQKTLTDLHILEKQKSMLDEHMKSLDETFNKASASLFHRSLLKGEIEYANTLRAKLNMSVLDVDNMLAALPSLQ